MRVCADNDVEIAHAVPVHDREYLKERLAQIRELCEAGLKLKLNEKTQIFPLLHGVDYLGWRFYLTDTGKVIKKLRQSGKRRLKQRLKGLQAGYGTGRLEWEEIKCSMAATNGHLIHGHTYRLRAKLSRETVFIRKSGEESSCKGHSQKD
jgi:hypothetical protein